LTTHEWMNELGADSPIVVKKVIQDGALASPLAPPRGLAPSRKICWPNDAQDRGAKHHEVLANHRDPPAPRPTLSNLKFHSNSKP
jgi:hypothetical protein